MGMFPERDAANTIELRNADADIRDARVMLDGKMEAAWFGGHLIRLRMAASIAQPSRPISDRMFDHFAKAWREVGNGVGDERLLKFLWIYDRHLSGSSIAALRNDFHHCRHFSVGRVGHAFHERLINFHRVSARRLPAVEAA
jgi:hypothetical protein